MTDAAENLTVVSPEVESFLYTADKIFYLLFHHQDLDPSLIESRWFEYKNERKMFEDIVSWNESRMAIDAEAFDLKTKNDLSFTLKKFEGIEKPKPETFSIYADILKHEWMERDIWSLLDDVRVGRYTDEGAIEALCKFADYVRDAKNPPLKTYISNEYALDFVESLEARRHIEEPELKTGFPSIDNNLWGLHRGELVVFGARPAVGKSAFMLNIASNLLKVNKKVLYFSTEMSVEEQWCRLYPIVLGIPAYKFRRAQFDTEEWAKINEQCEKLHESDNFIICDSASPNFEQVCALVRKHKPDVAILDYLQRFTMPDADRPDLSIGEFMKRLKTMARTEDVSVLVPSQLNRAVENRPSKNPHIADLRDSGNIEQESDIVILLSNENPEDKSETITLNAIIAKNRHGMCGTIPILFNRAKQQMFEMERIDA